MEPSNELEENEWPSPMSTPPPPLSPTPSPPPVPDREPTLWETLKALENKPLSTVTSVMRELMYGNIYAHLPNENVDWNLKGSTVCRVEGTRCHDQDFEELDKLQEHLGTSYHLAHNATQSPLQRTPPLRRHYMQIRQEVQARITQSDDMAISEATNDEIAPLSETSDSQGSITLPFTNSASVSVQERGGFQEADDKHDDDSDSVESSILV